RCEVASFTRRSRYCSTVSSPLRTRSTRLVASAFSVRVTRKTSPVPAGLGPVTSFVVGGAMLGPLPIRSMLMAHLAGRPSMPWPLSNVPDRVLHRVVPGLEHVRHRRVGAVFGRDLLLELK